MSPDDVPPLSPGDDDPHSTRAVPASELLGDETGQSATPRAGNDPTRSAAPTSAGGTGAPDGGDDLTRPLAPTPPTAAVPGSAASTRVAVPAVATGPPPGGPPPEPPPGAVPDDEPAGSHRTRTVLIVTLVVLFALAVGIAAFLFTASDGDRPQAAPVTLEPHDRVGDDPFTRDAARRSDAGRARSLADASSPGDGPTDEPTGPAPTLSTEPQRDPAGTDRRTGSDPGLYGATQGSSSCDREVIADDLAANGATQASWASIQGVRPGDTGSWIATLTPVVLLHDTRVTDHRNTPEGRTAHQAVLQAGSAVLIDTRGVPVVRCTSGAPLAPPVVHDSVLFVGDPWVGFEANRVIGVQPGAERQVFVLVDLASGEPFSRPAGSDGSDDAAIGTTTTTTAPTTTTTAPTTTTTTPTTTTTSTTTTTTTTIPDPEPSDITARGSVTASSTYDPSTGPGRATDGDPRTSWFGGGSDADPDGSTYTWTLAGRALIESVSVAGNGSHANPAFRTSTGFESLTIEVLDGSELLYSETFGLPGTPDPRTTARPDVRGDTVRLTFTGAERADIGGFSELTVIGLTQ